MSKYFAKYLPVEGKIKEGDWFQGITTGYKPSKCTVTDLENIYINPNVQGGTKLELSLCSRDIQVGDDFQQNPATLPAYISTCTEVKDDFVMCDENRGWAKATIFKVIGEISKDAVWVTEGMEFEEEEIKRDVLTKWIDEGEYTEYEHYYPKGNEEFFLPDGEKFIKEYPIKIKCPTCKTFH